jgi:hypothetical protein
MNINRLPLLPNNADIGFDVSLSAGIFHRRVPGRVAIGDLDGISG